MNKRKQIGNHNIWLFLNGFLGRSGIYSKKLAYLRQELAWRIGNHQEMCIRTALRGLNDKT
jgi:hypothetical protein